MTNRRAGLMITATLLLAVPAEAGDLGVLKVQRVFADDLGHPLPNTLIVVRIIWVAPDPADQLVGVVGSPRSPLSLEISGGTFFDSSHFLAGDRPPAEEAVGVPGFEELAYDSWITIGNSSLDVGPDWPSGADFTDQVIVAPGTGLDLNGQSSWSGGPEGPDNIAWTVPPSLPDPGGGGIEPTPQTVAGNWFRHQVLLGQFTIEPDGDSVDLEGTIGLIVSVDGQLVETTGYVLAPLLLCSADLDQDGIVGVGDLLEVMKAWGDPSGFYLGDANQDSFVDILDLLAIILAWGPCPDGP